MKLEDFAKQAGCVVSIDPNPEGWGGKWQFYTKGRAEVIYAGFRTEKSAYKGFMEEAFGSSGTKAILALLKKVERLESSNKELRRKYEKEVLR